jgi:hypothetical protein
MESTRVCDCDHDRSEHAGAGCRECANTWSEDGACRAGGFTNSEMRLTTLQEFWDLFALDTSEHGSRAVLGQHQQAIAEPPRSALPCDYLGDTGRNTDSARHQGILGKRVGSQAVV